MDGNGVALDHLDGRSRFILGWSSVLSNFLPLETRRLKCATIYSNPLQTTETCSERAPFRHELFPSHMRPSAELPV